jgi:hypothetical protein
MDQVLKIPYRKKKIPVLDEPDANVFSSCRTVNCIAVYGIYINSAGTFPLQNPCTENKSGTVRITIKNDHVHSRS